MRTHQIFLAFFSIEHCSSSKNFTKNQLSQKPFQQMVQSQNVYKRHHFWIYNCNFYYSILAKHHFASRHLPQGISQRKANWWHFIKRSHPLSNFNQHIRVFLCDIEFSKSWCFVECCFKKHIKTKIETSTKKAKGWVPHFKFRSQFLDENSHNRLRFRAQREEKICMFAENRFWCTL